MTSSNKIRRGSVNIQGVEFDHCGQFDTDRAALNFFYLNGPRMQSIVRGNSFHDSKGELLNAVQSHDLRIENNFFYNGVKVLASMIEGQNN